MSIADWWPHLDPSARQWLIDHNGETVPSWLATQIADALRLSTTSELDAGPLTVELSDDDVDWIEAVANDEMY